MPHDRLFPEPIYQWTASDPQPAAIAASPTLHPVAVQLLYNRGITEPAAMLEFLAADWTFQQHDPGLFRDMGITVERIVRAVTQQEKIVIHGDYDADGVCGTAVLYKTLQAIGAQVDVYLPHRDTEGYGLNNQTVRSLADVGTQLIITVDCGISNKPEIALAVSLGMDVIVTDHHSEPPELPDAALAVLNPKITGETYPFRYLAGVGVSFKLCQALIQYYDLGEAFEKWLLDLVALSTVTDCVELIGENRMLLKYGLIVMRKNRRPGLAALCTQLGIEPETVDVDTIGFKIGPHINAAGRVKHANQAFDLVIEEDPVRATQLATELIATNRERQALSKQMSDQAILQAADQATELVMIIELPDCPVGLVGLVAGKVSAEYQRPTFVITQANGEISGSGRSIEHFNLVEGMQSMDELFTKYGGHPMACGFSLTGPDALRAFKQRFRQLAAEQLAGKDLRKQLKIDMELPLAGADWSVVDVLEQCAPYGQANPKPVFMARQVEIITVSKIGKRQDHARLTISQDGTIRQCIGFGFGAWADALQIGDRVDIAYYLSVNEWNGNRNLQLVIQDIRS